MKVKDVNGNVIDGLVRTPGGGLAVGGTTEYYKYLHQKQAINEMSRLKDEVEELKQLVNLLLEKNNG